MHDGSLFIECKLVILSDSSIKVLAHRVTYPLFM